MKMMRQIRFVTLAVLAGGALLAGCKGTDWSSHKNWPKQHEFQGQIVQFHRSFLPGDYDAEDAALGVKPATIQTYYSYEKDGIEILHGKYTAWYEEGKPKAVTVYVHNKKQSSTKHFYEGGVRERLEVHEDGEERFFHDRGGKRIGRQLYDTKTGKRTCMLGDRIVPLDDFMFEINRRVYGVKRITPR